MTQSQLAVRVSAARQVEELRNTYTFAAMDFGRRLGARDEHIPSRHVGIRSEQQRLRPKDRPPPGCAEIGLGLRCSVGRVSLGIHSLPRASPQANLSATNV